MERRRILTHFTNAEGLSGITGLDPDSLFAGEATIVNRAQFGVGWNPHYASAEGVIFITEHGPDVSEGTLNGIGVFPEKQQFAIQIDAETYFNNEIRIMPERISLSIFSIPANSLVLGEIRVTKRF